MGTPADKPLAVTLLADGARALDPKLVGVARALAETFPGEIAAELRLMPAPPFPPEQERAAEALLAARAQGRLWDWLDRMAARRGKPEDPSAAAAALGMDVARFQDDVRAHRFLPAVEDDETVALRMTTRCRPVALIEGLRDPHCVLRERGWAFWLWDRIEDAHFMTRRNGGTHRLFEVELRDEAWAEEAERGLGELAAVRLRRVHPDLPVTVHCRSLQCRVRWRRVDAQEQHRLIQAMSGLPCAPTCWYSSRSGYFVYRGLEELAAHEPAEAFLRRLGDHAGGHL